MTDALLAFSELSEIMDNSPVSRPEVAFTKSMVERFKVDTSTTLIMSCLYNIERKLYENNIHIMAISASSAAEKGTKIDIGRILFMNPYLEMLSKVLGRATHMLLWNMLPYISPTKLNRYADFEPVLFYRLNPHISRSGFSEEPLSAVEVMFYLLDKNFHTHSTKENDEFMQVGEVANLVDLINHSKQAGEMSRQFNMDQLPAPFVHRSLHGAGTENVSNTFVRMDSL